MNGVRALSSFFLSLFLWPFNNDVQFNLGGGHLHLSSVRCSSLSYFAFGPGELCMRPACRKANFDWRIGGFFLADGNFSPLRGSPSFGLGLAASGFGT